MRVDRLAAGAMVLAHREDPAARQVELQIGVAQLPVALRGQRLAAPRLRSIR